MTIRPDDLGGVELEPDPMDPGPPTEPARSDDVSEAKALVEQVREGLRERSNLASPRPMYALDLLAAALDSMREELDVAYKTAQNFNEQQFKANAELARLREKAKTAKSIAAAPDYDEEAIKFALWAVVAAILAPPDTAPPATYVSLADVGITPQVPAPPDTATSDFQQCKDCAWDLCWQSKALAVEDLRVRLEQVERERDAEQQAGMNVVDELLAAEARVQELEEELSNWKKGLYDALAPDTAEER